VPWARKSADPLPSFATFFCFRLEHVDEQFSDRLAFFFGIVDALERLEEKLLGGHVHERDVVVVAKQRDDALTFGEPKEAVIDEHAGELLADRLMDEHRGDGGIDTARQSANHPAFADLAADFLDRLVLERAHGPVAGAAGDVAHEVAQDGRAVRRVHDFEMELRGVELALFIGDHRDRRIGRGAGRGKALRRPGDAVAVAHPNGITLPDLPHILVQRGRFCHLDLGAPEFAVMAALDLAAELPRHRLLAVTNSKHRHAGLIDRHRRKRRALVEDRGRPARENYALWPQGAQSFLGLLVRYDLAIDGFFADPPRDQLGDLRAEIDDEDGVVHGR
jgi:hypothetical protein